jgi:hypothetical protein
VYLEADNEHQKRSKGNHAHIASFEVMQLGIDKRRHSMRVVSHNTCSSQGFGF